jgi:glycosyltransferase involved in cell wall biosynthesis
LNSIISCSSNTYLKFQVCISDNNSSDNTEDVVKATKSLIDIKYNKNTSNLGIPKNFIKVVSMADGDFVWLIGDDDLLMPYAIEELYKLIDSHPEVDFFYANSFHLTTEFLNNYPSPFDTANLPNAMEPFSKWPNAGKMSFLELIDPKVSFDFLGGMFLSVFRRENWMRNVNVLDDKALQDSRTFSHFDNTFPHVKIFAKAFASSQAYFNKMPLSVCLSGAREWSSFYPLIHSVRLVEALQEYRNNGLPYWKYIYCKNYALNNFLPEFIYIILRKNKSGYAYINPLKLFFESALFPNFYLSSFYFIGRHMRKLCVRIFSKLVS